MARYVLYPRYQYRKTKSPSVERLKGFLRFSILVAGTYNEARRMRAFLKDSTFGQEPKSKS